MSKKETFKVNYRNIELKKNENIDNEKVYNSNFHLLSYYALQERKKIQLVHMESKS